MRASRRHVRSLVLAIVSVSVLAFGAATATAGADEPELIDVSKKTNEIQNKISELRERGRWARRGELSMAAVCGDEESSKVFASWGDMADYVPAPQGDVESTTGWDLDDHASVIDENSPFSGGSHSLLLTDGADATTPVICISTSHPTIRFFAANTGAANARLEIEIVYEDLDGHVKKLKIARLRGSDEWNPTIIVPIYMNMLAAASEEGVTAVALRFKARDVKSKNEGWKIDDVAVDPWKDT